MLSQQELVSFVSNSQPCFLPNAPESLEKTEMKFTFNGKTAVVPWRSPDLNSKSQGWTILVPKNEIVQIGMQDSEDFTDFEMIISLLEVNINDWTILQFNKISKRPDFLKLDGTDFEQDKSLDENCSHNDWFFDDNHKNLQIMLKNDNSRTWNSTKKIHHDVLNSIVVNSVENTQESVSAIIFNFVYTTCDAELIGSCDFLISEPEQQEHDLMIAGMGLLSFDNPKTRPHNCLFTSNMPFGTAIEIENYGFVRPTEGSTSSIIRSGENLYIQHGTWLVVDEAMPLLGNVYVLGVLEISDDVREIRMKNLIVLGGTVTLTSHPTNGMLRKEPLKILFEGEQGEENFQFGPDVTFGNKGLACFGDCDLRATGSNFNWALLGQDAYPGDKTISILNSERIEDWSIGDEILLSSTSFDMKHIDEMIIESIDLESDPASITFTEALLHFHRGIPDNENLSSQIGEVIKTNRLVEIEGIDTSYQDGFGARIFVGDIYIQGFNKNEPQSYKGRGRFRNLKFKNMAQYGLEFQDIRHDPRWAIIYQDVSSPDNIVTSCHFENSNGNSVGIIRSEVKTKANTFYRSTHGAIESYNSPKAKIEDNLAVNTLHLSNYVEEILNIKPYIPEKPYAVVFKTDNSITKFQGNRVASATMAGISHPGIDCDFEEDDYASKDQFMGNTVRGAQFGYLYYNEPLYKCEMIRHLDISHSYLIGAFIIIHSEDHFPKGKINVFGSHIANSGFSNIYQMISKKDGSELDSEDFFQTQVRISYYHMSLYGHTNNFNCSQEYLPLLESSDNPFNNYQFSEMIDQEFYPTSFNAAYLGTSGIAKFPGYTDILTTRNFNSLRESTRFSNVNFINVGGTQNTCDDLKPSYAIGSIHSHKQMSYLLPAFLKKSTKVNVNDDYLTKYPTPYEYMVSESQCIDLDCNAFTTQLISDFDGTFTGISTVRGTILPNPEYIWNVKDAKQQLDYSRVPVIAKMDYYGAVLLQESLMPNVGRMKHQGNCHFNKKMNAHFCQGPDSYTYNYLIVSNHDFDTRTRRVGPLTVITNRGINGTVDIYNSPHRESDAIWGRSTGIYKSTVALGNTVELFFASTPPEKLRLQIEGSGFSQNWGKKTKSEKLLVKFYNPSLNELKVSWLPVDQTLPLQKNSLTPLNKAPTLNDATGSYYHDRFEQMLYLVISDNDKVYEIVQSNQITMSFGIPPILENEFYSEKLVSNVASYFAVPNHMIKVMTVVSESESNALQRKRRNVKDFKNNYFDIIDIEINLDEASSEEIDSVEKANDILVADAQLGEKQNINKLLSNVSSKGPTSRNAIDVQTIAILSNAKTEEAKIKGPVANRAIPQIHVCPSSGRGNRYRNRMVTFLNTFWIGW